MLYFSVSFECLICHPVEGMQIKCKIDNVTKAGIRASYYNNIESPLIFCCNRSLL